MNHRGKYVIVGILGVAVCAAAFAAWYQYRNQQRAHDFWGTTSAVLIAEAPQVEVLWLGEPASGGQIDEDTADDPPGGDGSPKLRTVEFGDLAWKVLSSKEGTAARGIKNIRRALVLDTTFDWRNGSGNEEPEWQYALGFTDRKNWATVLFDLETGRVALTGGRKTALLDPAASKDLRDFFAEQFAERAAEDSSAAPAEKPGESTAAPPADGSREAPPEAAVKEK